MPSPGGRRGLMRRAVRRRWCRFWWPTVEPDRFGADDVVVVHEWLASFGSDKVAAELVTAGDAVALVCLSVLPGAVDDLDVRVPVHQCRLGGWAARGRRWQFLLPLAPVIWSALDLGAVRRTITSSHSLVNSVPVTADGAGRVCYCHTPVRYGWEWRMERGRLPVPLRPLFPLGARVLRAWDRHVTARVEVFVANSTFVAGRIQAAYDRDAMVIHPPIDTDWFRLPTAPPTAAPQEFLVAGRFVPYKRVDLAVRAATEAGVPLVVAGSGPDAARLAALAGPTVRFVDQPCDEELRTLLQRSKALVHPGVEDFGMMVVEAQACGTPVIARAAGGVLDSVDPSCSGVLVDGDDVADWANALLGFTDPADASTRREFALGFSRAAFHARVREVLAATWSSWQPPASVAQ